jgi:hypothetical protein
MSKKAMTELDLEIEQLGSDIDTLAKGIDAHLVENAQKLAPKPLTQVQIRALVLGCHVSGARRAGQRTGFGISGITAARLIEMGLLMECYVSGNYLITAAGKLVLDFPENRRRADALRRLGT